MPTRTVGFAMTVAIATVAANFAVLPEMPLATRVLGFVLFMFMIPGAALIQVLLPAENPFRRTETMILSAGASVALAVLVLWILFLLPLKLSQTNVVAAFDLLISVLCSLTLMHRQSAQRGVQPRMTAGVSRSWLAVLLLFVFALALVTIRLDVLELSGDEFSVTTRALDILLDKRESLFGLTKGPAQILLVAGVMRLTDSLDEGILRLPFALSAIIATLVFAQLAHIRLRLQVALTVGILMISQGMLLGMARWIQYQMFVMAMSLLALYCAWRARQVRRTALAARYWLLTALFAGTGLLGHYDIGLIFPALAVTFIGAYRGRLRKLDTWRVATASVLLAGLIAVPFYILYLSRAQGLSAIETNYVNDRVNLSGAPYNHLNEFLLDMWDFESAYRVPLVFALIGVAGYLALRSAHEKRSIWWIAAGMISAIGVVFTALVPSALTLAGINLSFVPTLALFAILFLRVLRDPFWLMVLTWACSVFAFTGFLMARPFDHYFMGLPALLLAMGYGLNASWRHLRILVRARFVRLAVPALFAAWLVVVVSYVVLEDIAYYPDMLLSHPERSLPFFAQLGSPHQQTPAYYGVSVGWRTMALLFMHGDLRGENDSTVEQSRDWYLSKIWQPTTTNPRYFIVARPQKPGFAKRQQPQDSWDNYDLWGTILVDGDPQIKILEHKVPGTTLSPRTLIAEDYHSQWLDFAKLSRIESFKANQRDDSAFYSLSRVLAASEMGNDALIIDTKNAGAILNQFYTGAMPYVDVTPPEELSQYRRVWGVWWANNPAFAETEMAAKTYPTSAQWFGNIRLRVYGVAHDLPTRTIAAKVGELATLQSASTFPTPFRPGDLLPLQLQWHTDNPSATRLKLFVHVSGADGKPIAQADSEPLADLRPTSTWRTGETVNDRIGIWLPPDAKSGRYQVVAGLYEPNTGGRLTAVSSEGNRYPNDAISLGEIEILRP